MENIMSILQVGVLKACLEFSSAFLFAENNTICPKWLTDLHPVLSQHMVSLCIVAVYNRKTTDSMCSSSCNDKTTEYKAACPCQLLILLTHYRYNHTQPVSLKKETYHNEHTRMENKDFMSNQWFMAPSQMIYN